MSMIFGLCAAALIITISGAVKSPPPARLVIPVASDDHSWDAEALTTPGPGSPTLARSGRSRRLRLVRSAAAGVVTTLLVGVAAVAIGAASWFVWNRLQPVLKARRRQRLINQVMPDTVELFVLIVHAGLTPRQAVEELAERAPLPVRRGFSEVVAKLERGESLADALRVLPSELGLSALALADIVGSADRYGLALGPVLEQLAAESRSTRRRLDEAAARSLPVKLSFPLVVCTLPSFVLLAIIPAVLAALSSLGANAW